jgi:hypothetical protein
MSSYVKIKVSGFSKETPSIGGDFSSKISACITTHFTFDRFFMIIFASTKDQSRNLSIISFIFSFQPSVSAITAA